MCHTEGGWPKDINMKDVEQTVRYKRKIEKDELYIHTMLQLLPVIMPFISLLQLKINKRSRVLLSANGTLYFTKQYLQYL